MGSLETTSAKWITPFPAFVKPIADRINHHSSVLARLLPFCQVQGCQQSRAYLIAAPAS
jgi:hypothetical protein